MFKKKGKKKEAPRKRAPTECTYVSVYTQYPFLGRRQKSMRCSDDGDDDIKHLIDNNGPNI
jgi:hypothetical protein